MNHAIDLLAVFVGSTALVAMALDVFSAKGLESLRIDLLDHLALLTARGLPLAPGVSALAVERAPRWRVGRRAREAEQLRRVAAGLQEHGSLSTALAEVPELLAPDQLTLLRVAEERGGLPAVIERLSQEEAERDTALHRALEIGFYALIVSLVVLLVSAFLAVVVLPRFREIEQSMGVDPSGGHALVVGVTWAYAGLCLAAACAFLPGVVGRWLRWRGLHALAGLPGVGRPLRRWLLGRWLQRVAALLQHGATLPEALEQVAATPGSTPGQATAAQRAREGRPLAEVLEVGLGADAPALAPSLLLTVERAGSLAEGWRDGAERVAERAGRRLLTWGEALRPLPVVLCAAVVAAHYVSMWLSIVAVQGVVIRSVW